MKHLDEGHRTLLSTLLEECGVLVAQGVQEQLLKHLDWVLEQNLTMNLTAIRDPSEAVRLHTLDSLLALPEIRHSEPGLMVDLGTGGGFPGLPLALAGARDALLLDSVRKKSDSLQEFVTTIPGSVKVQSRAQRAEELATGSPGLAMVVVARAVAALPSLVELASPLLGEGGVLVALKGRLDSEEVRRADSAGKTAGMVRTGVRKYTLPAGGEQRSVVVYARVGEPSISLPRRTGMAQRRPLA